MRLVINKGRGVSAFQKWDMWAVPLQLRDEAAH